MTENASLEMESAYNRILRTIHTPLPMVAPVVIPPVNQAAATSASSPANDSASHNIYGTYDDDSDSFSDTDTRDAAVKSRCKKLRRAMPVHMKGLPKSYFSPPRRVNSVMAQYLMPVRV